MVSAARLADGDALALLDQLTAATARHPGTGRWRRHLGRDRGQRPPARCARCPAPGRRPLHLPRAGGRPDGRRRRPVRPDPWTVHTGGRRCAALGLAPAVARSPRAPRSPRAAWCGERSAPVATGWNGWTSRCCAGSSDARSPCSARRSSRWRQMRWGGSSRLARRGHSHRRPPRIVRRRPPAPRCRHPRFGARDRRAPRSAQLPPRRPRPIDGRR